MKKIFLFVAVAALGLGTVACSSDDNSSPNYQNDILGEWKEVKTTYLDKDRKVVDEETASTNDGCGVDEIEFKSNTILFKFPFKTFDTKECKVDMDEDTYTISGKTITSVYFDGDERIENKIEIIELTKTKLVLESSDIEEEFEDGTVYIRTEYSKK
jgi:hypothetical protein